MFAPQQPSFAIANFIPANFIPANFMPILGMLVCVAFTPITLAASEGSGAPVSSVETESTAMTGEEVYNNVCIACHYPPGVGGAPALGDAEAWAPRIAQGIEILVYHALNGFTGSTGVMPKKGERLDISDEEIIKAVEYMVGQVQDE